LDDANLNDDAIGGERDTVDSSLANMRQQEVNDRMGPVSDSITEFKIHQMVYKKSSFIKEPQLFSKNIEV